MQVFDLKQLLLLDTSLGPVTFGETAQYNAFGNAHNIFINEDSGFAFAVGTNTCNGGLHMVNISTPASPTYAGCYAGDSYTHDVQCVNYNGPDPQHQNKEICFASNEDTLTIVDVTDKAAPVQISRTIYDGKRYTHQGWLTSDQVHFVFGDELDEIYDGHFTRTRVFDLSVLDAPQVAGSFEGSTPAIDHNQYIKGDHVYQANYRAGLRVLKINDVSNADFTEVAYFDVYPEDDNANFNGAWSNYPYFPSGVVVVSSMERGLFVLGPNLSTPPPPPATSPDAPSALTVKDKFDGTAEIAFTDNSDNETAFELQREKQHKKRSWNGTTIINLPANSNNHIDPSGTGTFRYRARAVNLVGVSGWTEWGEVTVTSGSGGDSGPKCHPRRGCP